MTSAISVSNVTKRFRIPMDRTSTLKYRVTHPISTARYRDLLAVDDVPITSVDWAPQDDEGFSRLMARHGVGDNMKLIVGDSQHTKYPEVGEIDLLFVDGDHSYEGCKADLENWFPNLVPGGHIVMHDGYFGVPVQDAAIDFMREHDVEAVRPPWIHAIHWHNPTGSLVHFVKRS